MSLSSPQNSADNSIASTTISGTVSAVQSGIWSSRLQDGSGNSISSTTGSLNVNITGGSSSGPTDTDDGSVATGQLASLGIGLSYGYNGATWERLNSSSNRLIVDGSQVTQPISGSVSVSNFPATQPVSGTVTANAGTGNFTVVQSTGTNLHTVVDSGSITVANATLAVTQSTSPWVVSLASTTITGSVAVTGPLTDTQLRASAVPVSLASTTITGTVAVTQSTSPWVVSGTVTSNIGTTNGLALDATLAKLTVSQGTALGTNAGPMVMGSVTTASPTYTTGQISPLSLDTTGALRVNVTAGSSSGTVAQGSTTSGQSGNLIQGAVTTAAPTYTTAQTNPLSLTTSGLLRVDGSGVTQPVSGTVTANAGTGNFTVVQATGTNLHTVTDTTVTTTDKSTTGTITALNGAVTISTNGTGATIFQLTGTWVATLVAEGSIDGSNWANLSIFPAIGTLSAIGVSATGSYRIPSTGGYSSIRIRASAFTSGTVSVAMNLSSVVAAPQLFSPTPTNAKVTAFTSTEAAALLNQTFGVSLSVNLAVSGTEAPTILIRNPSGSGKTMILKFVQTSPNETANGTAITRMYITPSVLTNGTAQTNFSTVVGSGATSVVLTTTSPTVTSTGTLVYGSAIGSGTSAPINNQTDMSGIFRIAANQAILFTGQPSVNNLSVNWSLVWSEE